MGSNPQTKHTIRHMMISADSHRNVIVFEREFFPQINALYNFAYHLTYSEEDSNDLVQETYLKAYKHIDKYQKGTNAKAWLFRILKNAFINEYRKKTNRPSKVDFDDIVLMLCPKIFEWSCYYVMLKDLHMMKLLKS